MNTDDTPILFGDKNEVKMSTSTTYNTVIEDDGEFVPDNNNNGKSEQKFHIYIALKYNKPYAPLADDYIRVSVTPENGKSYEKTIYLANYRIDGTPINTCFTFGNGEVPVGHTAQVCVENMMITLGNSCKMITNGPEHEPEAVTLVIPKSR